MIERKTFLALAFYKKEVFTGSDAGMRYRIEKTDIGTEEEPNVVLKATAWPEPFAFPATPDEKKVSETFPFSEEGLEQIAAWLNTRPA